MTNHFGFIIDERERMDSRFKNIPVKTKSSDLHQSFLPTGNPQSLKSNFMRAIDPVNARIFNYTI